MTHQSSSCIFSVSNLLEEFSSEKFTLMVMFLRSRWAVQRS